MSASDRTLEGFIYLLVGSYFLWVAWITLVWKRSVLPPLAPIVLWALSTFKSRGAARRAEARLRSAGQRKLYGVSALFGGLLSIWIALLTFQPTLFQGK